MRNFIRFCYTAIISVLITITLSVSTSGILNAQNNSPIKVTGTVTAVNGEPEIGVTITEVGKNIGTVTDINGFFSINVSSANATLEFSSIGMKKVSITLNGRTQLQITMEEDVTELDELVVIGYGTVQKSDLTGSVSSVSDKLFNDKMVTSVEDALRGQIPGVKIVSSDGQPGQSMNIRIRGTGSINASNSPLYVVDGVLMESLDISPGDIERMEILKDASATAIYGSRGANGVVIITTKRGSKGKTRIEFNTQLSVQQPVRLIEMMDSYEYAEMRYRQTLGNQYWKRLGPTPTFAVGKNYYADSEGNYYGFDKSNAWSDYNKYSDAANYNNPDQPLYNTDWQRAMLRNAITNDYRISISGADDKTSFSVLGNYYAQEGIVINSGAKRGSFRTNFDRTLSDWAKMGFNLNGSIFNQEGLASNETQGVTMNMLSQPPTKALSETEWEAVPGEDSNVNNNPFYQATHITKDVERKNMIMRLNFELDLPSNLKYRGAGNYTYSNQLNQNFYPKTTNQGRNYNGRAQYQTFQTQGWIVENLLFYTPKKWGDHRFDAMGGITMEESEIKRINAETHNIAVESLGANALQEGTVATVAQTPYSKTRIASFLARANYNLKERYMFTVTMRADGSSRFGADHKWAYFPSAAYAWRAKEESFLQNIDFLSNLKFRVSYGISGNTAIPAYQSLDAMGPSFYPMNGSETIYGINTLRPQNPDLKWETSSQYNAGIDIGFFNNRLTSTIDFYLKKTRDLLFEVSTPAHTGYTSRWSNFGAIDNKGVEIAINGVPVSTKKISWDLDFNIAFNRSNVVNIGESDWMILNPGIHPTLTNFGYLQVGERIGNWYGFKTDGVWRKQSDIDMLPVTYSQLGVDKQSIFPGHTKFVDVNEDNVINDNDRVILGNGEPLFTGGFSSSFRYSNFMLNVGLEFAYKFDIFNATAKYLEELRGSNNQLQRASNYWRPILYDITTGEMVDPGNENSNLRRPNSPQEMRALDRHIEDGSYLRVNDITLSYSLPSQNVSRLHMRSLSVFFSIKNAFVFTNYTGYDPDVSVGRGVYSDLLPHLDYGAYPQFRGYTVGLKFSF